MKFTIEEEEVLKCLEYVNDDWKHRTQSIKGLKSHSKTKEEFFEEQIEGKLAELILKKFLKSKGITTVNLDFNHYKGKDRIDSKDFRISLNNKKLSNFSRNGGN